ARIWRPGPSAPSRKSPTHATHDGNLAASIAIVVYRKLRSWLPSERPSAGKLPVFARASSVRPDWSRSLVPLAPLRSSIPRQSHRSSGSHSQPLFRTVPDTSEPTNEAVVVGRRQLLPARYMSGCKHREIT